MNIIKHLFVEILIRGLVVIAVVYFLGWIVLLIGGDDNQRLPTIVTIIFLILGWIVSEFVVKWIWKYWS